MTNYTHLASPLWDTYYDACCKTDAYLEYPDEPTTAHASKVLKDAFNTRDSLEQLCDNCLESHFTGVWDAPTTWVCPTCKGDN